jgi:uncharacterized protein
MRILHATDFHFNQRWYEWLTLQAGSFDACCLTGDLLDMLRAFDSRAGVSLTVQTRWVQDWMRAFPGRLFVCSGNHDEWSDGAPMSPYIQGGWLRLARRPGAVFVDNDTVVLEGYRFVCTPWAQIPEVDSSMPHIVLCHAPPEGTLVSRDLGRESGDPEVARAIRELPRGSLFLSGHVHDPKRWYARMNDTYCFNPGFNARAVAPNHIIIDTVTLVATFSGWGRDLGPIHLPKPSTGEAV